MRLLIWHKLFIAMLSAMLVVVGITLLLTRWSFNRGFLDYINRTEAQRIETVAENLAEIYAKDGSWETLLRNRDRWRGILERSGPDGPRLDEGFVRQAPPGRRRMSDERRELRGNQPGLRDRLPPRGFAGPRKPIDLLDSNRNLLLGQPVRPAGAELIPIELDGATIGYLRYLPRSALLEVDEEAERQFIEQQLAAVQIIAGVALLIAAGLALIFGRRLVAPVRELVHGTRALAAGQLDRRIDVRRSDELGALAEDFNRMAAALEHSRATQQQWVGDIAHELRTPLAILNGELQALEDGIRNWTPQTRDSLQAEINRLTALVNDLHDVSLSEAGGLGYRRETTDLTAIVLRAIDSLEHRLADRGLTVQTEIPDNSVTVYGDIRRLEQLVVNLLENSCRYTDRGGTVRITCTGGNPVRLCIEDSAPGVPEAALARLFDRLYRVESSRHREHGGSGLGLAICKGIVEAHGGTIRARPASLGGLSIEVELPRDSS